jgi:hypothetical protein
MLANLKSVSGAALLICVGIGLTTNGASAMSVEVAKRCGAQTAKEFPPREPGNPAAGHAKGTESSQEYYKKCLADNSHAARPGAAAPSTTGSGVLDANREYAEPKPYKPCPASVARNGKNFCLP